MVKVGIAVGWTAGDTRYSQFVCVLREEKLTKKEDGQCVHNLDTHTQTLLPSPISVSPFYD